MTVAKLDITSWSDIEEGAFDCVWVWLKKRSSPTPIEAPNVQWVDWRLQGSLSRHIGEQREDPLTTFIPTRSRMKTPYVAIENSVGESLSKFWENAEGMGLKKILFLCEEAAEANTLQKMVQKEKNNYPIDLYLG